MTTRSQFQNCTNRMASCKQSFFNGGKVFEHRWIILADCHVDGIGPRELERAWNPSIYNSSIARCAKFPMIFLVATLVQVVL